MPISHQGQRRIVVCFLISAGIILTTGCGNNQSAGSKRVASATAQQSGTEQDGSAMASVLAISGSTRKSPAIPRDRQAEDADVAAIEKLEGRVEIEGPERTVIKVDLGRRTVTDADLAHLKLFAGLQELDLHAPQITDAGLEHLQVLTNLRVLSLNFTSITGPGLVHLRAMTQLQELDLGSSHLQDTGLEYLRGLTQLRTLNLKLTGVSDAGLEHLRTLLNLQQLDVRLTHVTEAGVKQLQQALPKLRIDF